ncbi:MAG: metallophosphoesterase [Flaviaesturariibacter sp.]|nr:metallophosphoesterase [Flaviaesturariibacter sp.]
MGRLSACFFLDLNFSLLRIVAISDTHGQHRALKLPRGDTIIHAGDLTFRGKKEEVMDFLGWFRALDFSNKILIAGNHDFFFEKESMRGIEGYLPTGVTYLQDTGLTIDGVHFWGSPYTPLFFNWAFNRKRGREIARHWGLVPPHTDVLITHGPPYGILDQVGNERPVGDRDLLKRVTEVRPKVHVFGHIHESYGTCIKEGVRYINASILNELYQPVHRPVVFDI